MKWNRKDDWIWTQMIGMGHRYHYHCARSKGNLNRNPYWSCSHSIPIPIPIPTMKRNERERWVCGWHWVGFVIVGYDCYAYVVVYALWLFLSVLLFCFRWFVFVFMSLLFMESLSTVFAMYCLSSFDSIRGVLLIDVSSFWVYCIKLSSCLFMHMWG